MFKCLFLIQAIAQLFIIIRVAQGRALGCETFSSRTRLDTMAFAAGKPEDSVFQGPHGTETTAAGSSMSWERSKNGGKLESDLNWAY